ncbi:MAG TPA: patatin-like phospholipase family protein [Bacillota bacterium]|nr:patatin-like phospholipase family protein [Bacillota bacterium]
MRVDAVFEGGGVRGIAFLGAIEEMESAGYSWGNLAGTSAGSIIAALLAVGYSSRELMELFLSFPFQEIEKKTGICKIPLVGPWLSLQFNNGIYSSDIIETWLDKHLQEKGIQTFSDLGENKLKVIITDLSNNRVSILPDDLSFYHIEPGAFSIARAVRMSCSIPFILRPLTLSGNVIVDGGVLSNYPIWIFDNQDHPPMWPTIGFRLSGHSFMPQPKEILGPIDLSISLVRTMVDGHDNRYIDSHSAARTVFIKGIKVGSTDFDLPMETKLQLVQLGRIAVKEFISKWNFQKYIRDHRSSLRTNFNRKGYKSI